MKFGKNLSPNGDKGKRPATEFDDKLDPRGKTGKRLTILSIDGGGVRGIIPAKILQRLEIYLASEELDKNTGKHHLWEYFDIIAGTSSGGLITAMITTPKVGNPQLPTCNASQVVEFFQDDAVAIFPKTFSDNFRLRWLLEGFASLFGPIYSAEPLKGLLRAKFGDAHLSDALTSVIIPAFDTNNEVPVFFSNLKSVDSTKPLYNVRVRDACQATTAVPIFFPAACFNEQVSGEQNQSGTPEVFNVIDGGIAVNDPTLVAVTQAIVQERQAIAQDEQALKGRASEKEQKAIVQKRSRDCTDFRDVLVLSLGTGQHRMRFLPKPRWSSVKWLLNASGSPLLNSFLSASQDMVEYYTSMILCDAHQSGDNYLRIQIDSLSTSEFWGIDDATNLDELQETADVTLESGYVSEHNFAPGKLEARTSGERDKVALRRFAKLLVEERRELEKSKVHIVLPENFGRTRRISRGGENPGPAGTVRDGTAVQTAVDGRCLTMRTAVGGCCLMIRAIMLFIVCCFFYFFCFCHAICDVFSCRYWD